MPKIRGCIQEEPLARRNFQANLRLSPRAPFEHTRAQTIAILTSAIPLREPAPSEPRTFTRIYELQFRVRVRAYFAVQFDNFMLRCGPFHRGCSQISILSQLPAVAY